MSKHSKPANRFLIAGAVFRYAYVWHRQHLAGQSEAGKDRPAMALAVAVSDNDGQTYVLALPITHTPPKRDWHAVKLPDAAKRALGLDEAPSWIVTTESTRFIWPGSDVRPAPGRSSPFYGMVSPAMLRKVVRSYLANRQRSEAVSFDRYD